jgi:hypothetical protein
MSVRLVDLASDTRLGTTTVGLPPPLHAQLKALAKARNVSMNVLVNTALAHWLARKKTSASSKGFYRPSYRIRSGRQNGEKEHS